MNSKSKALTTFLMTLTEYIYMNDSPKGYKKFEVWQRGMDLAEEIYRLTKLFPREEKYGLVSQMRRAADSVPSNIAEGYAKYTPDELRHGARIAFGSACELETQLILSKRLQFAPIAAYINTEKLLDQVLRLCNGLASQRHPSKIRSPGPQSLVSIL